MSFDGTLLSTWDIPGTTAGLPNPDRPTPPTIAWSPDGATIAVQTRFRCADNGTRTEFVDAASGALRAPVESGPCLTLSLGWQSATTLVGMAPAGDHGTPPAVVLASLGTGSTTVLSQLPFVGNLYDMELARGLLAQVQVRPAGALPDFGPWEAILIVGLPAALVSAVAVYVAREVRRRRNQPLTRVEAGTLVSIG
jgi:hypothetical protein